MARKLTVLQMLPSLEGGGVERGTLEVAAALVQQGHRSLVMSTGGRMVAELLAGGSEHFAWPVLRKSLLTLRMVWPLRRFLVEQQVDILHVRSRVPAWIAWLAWRGMDPATRPRLVTTVHGLYSVGRYSRVMTRGERVIAVSQTVSRYIRESFPDVDKARVRVIPRGVDPQVFPYGYRPEAEWLAHWQRDFPQLEGRQVLTLSGRITRLKGHHDFIGLIAELKRRGRNVCGLIVGGQDPRRPGYAAELQRRVQVESLAEDILFTGHHSDMREIYAVSSLVLSLSTKPESFGRTVLEALSLGVPVAGYNHGGVGEILAAVYPQGLTPLGDPAALVYTVQSLLDQPPTVPERHPFVLASMLDATLSLYQELADAPRR